MRSADCASRAPQLSFRRTLSEEIPRAPVGGRSHRNRFVPRHPGERDRAGGGKAFHASGRSTTAWPGRAGAASAAQDAGHRSVRRAAAGQAATPDRCLRGLRPRTPPAGEGPISSRGSGAPVTHRFPHPNPASRRGSEPFDEGARVPRAAGQSPVPLAGRASAGQGPSPDGPVPAPRAHLFDGRRGECNFGSARLGCPDPGFTHSRIGGAARRQVSRLLRAGRYRGAAAALASRRNEFEVPAKSQTGLRPSCAKS